MAIKIKETHEKRSDCGKTLRAYLFRNSDCVFQDFCLASDMIFELSLEDSQHDRIRWHNPRNGETYFIYYRWFNDRAWQICTTLDNKEVYTCDYSDDLSYVAFKEWLNNYKQ